MPEALTSMLDRMSSLRDRDKADCEHHAIEEQPRPHGANECVCVCVSVIALVITVEGTREVAA